MNYWMLSYWQGLELLVQHDSRPHIRVSGQRRELLDANRLLLSNADRTRLEVVADYKEADYFLTTFRWKVYPYEKFPTASYTLRRSGKRVLSIFQVK